MNVSTICNTLYRRNVLEVCTIHKKQIKFIKICGRKSEGKVWLTIRGHRGIIKGCKIRGGVQDETKDITHRHRIFLRHDTE